MAFSSEIEKLERRWQENPLGLTFASLAELYRKAGETARALELIEQGMAQHPNYVPAHIVRARCHLDSHADSEAEQAFLRVTELDPENVLALKGLAELSERAGRIPEAVHRLELLLDVDRNNEEARGQLDRVKDLLANPVAPAAFERAAIPDVAAASAPETAAPPEVETFDDFIPELEVASQLTSVASDDYQVANDSESLQPSDDRIADIVLGSEPPEDFAFESETSEDNSPPAAGPPAPAGVDSVDVLLGEEYESLMSYRDVSTVPPVEAPSLEDTVFGQLGLMADIPPPTHDVLPPPPAPPFEQESFMPPPEAEPVPMAVSESALAPDADLSVASPVTESAHVEPSREEPEPEPEPILAAEAAAEPVAECEPGLEPTAYAPEPPPTGMVDDYVPLGDLGAPTKYEPAAPQAAEEPEPAVTDEPELVVTETMAEIFLRQGHRELAFAVYAQLAQREPENDRIAAALARLAPLAPAGTAPVPTPAPAPAASFAASETGGRSVGQLFGELLAAARPSVAPTIHPPAFEQPKRVSGEPTRPAQEALSLSSVFGEDAPPRSSSGAAPDSNPGEPSFDEFFAPATGSAAELPRSPESGAEGEPAQVPEDLEQFNAWLRGLKR